MRAVLQRVLRASVAVDGATVAAIDRGWLVLLGVAKGDLEADADRLAEKVAALRAFDDSDGKMNLDVGQIGGAVLVVSQFTLLGDCRKGRRPGFDGAAPPFEAEPIYQHFARTLADRGLPVALGVFGADMQIALVNDGPVTLLLDSRKAF